MTEIEQIVSAVIDEGIIKPNIAQVIVSSVMCLADATEQQTRDYGTLAVECARKMIE